MIHSGFQSGAALPSDHEVGAFPSDQEEPLFFVFKAVHKVKLAPGYMEAHPKPGAIPSAAKIKALLLVHHERELVEQKKNNIEES